MASRKKGVKWDSSKKEEDIRLVMARRLLKIGAQVESRVVKSISRDQPLATNKNTGERYGLDPAGPGKPPKVVTGRLRQSITHVLDHKKKLPRVRIGTNVEYAPYLEYGGHPFLRPGLSKSKKFILKTLGRDLKVRKR